MTFYRLLYKSVVTAIIITILYKFFIETEMLNIKKVKYLDIIDNLETGDILLYRWHYIDFGFRLFSKYSHVSMVLKHPIDNSLFSFEIHPKEYINTCTQEDRDKKPKILREEGVNIFPLLKRLEEYNGEIYILKMNSKKNKKELSTKIISRLNMYKNINFDNNFKNIFVFNKFLNSIGMPCYPKNNMFCSEFIGYILNDLGILNNEQKLKQIGNLSPGFCLDLEQYDNHVTRILLP